MALESVFAKALPKVGHANKDTQNGEMESAGPDPDDDVPAADLEEGEIIDSGQEDSDDQKPSATGKPPGPLLKGPPLPPQEVLRPPFAKMEKRKRKKRKKDELGGPEPKQKRYIDHDRMVDDTVWFSPDSGGGPSRGPPMHHGHHGGPMPPRDFGSPGPYDDNYMHMALLEDQLEFEHLCASRRVLLEEMLNNGLLIRIHPSDMSPRGGGCDSPDGSGGPEGHQEGMGAGGPPPHGGGFPGGRGGRGGGRGKSSFMMDSRRPGPPKKKKKKKMAMPGGRGGGKRGGGDGPSKRSVCKFYLDSKCVKGADCPFSHDVPQPRKADLCKFYLGGYCARGEHCSFMHQDFPCKFFHTGAKCYADTACRFSHQPLTDETRRLLHRYLDNHRDRGDDDNPPMGPGGPDPLDRPDGPDDDRGMNKPPCDEFGGPPQGKRPSLLGSPPRHVKEAAETWRMQFLGGGGGKGPPHVRGGPGGAGFGPSQGPPMMSPPRGGHPIQGFSPRPSFYMDTLSQSPVRGSMPPPGASPPHMAGPSAMHCLDEGFGGGPGMTGPMGPMRPLPHGQMGGYGSPNISSPPLQDQGLSCGPGFVPDGGMSPLGIFFDPSQDHPMSPPQQQQQSIPGLSLLGALSPPQNQAPAPTQIPANDTSSDEPHQSPQHATHHDEADTSDDSSHAVTDKKVLPPNLPRRQRELFMRIQQQQRAAAATASAEASVLSGTSPTATTGKEESPVPPVKPEPKTIAGLGNSESSDDDEDYDDDQLLKRLQQAPAEATSAPPTSILGSSCTTTAPSAAQPSSITLPSVGTMDIAKVLDSIRQQGPSQPQTNFWRQLFSGVSAATAAAASVAEAVPASFASVPAASRDPRRARADGQLAKTEPPQSSRDPRLRDKLSAAPKVTEVAFVESKDGDVPYRLTSILRALPNYDDVVRGGVIPESKLKNDPRLAKYVGQKLPEAVPPPVEVAPQPAMHSLPAVAILPKPPTVSRRDPRMARHLEQQQPLAVENKVPLIAEPPKVTPSPLAEVVPKADPRKAAALAANGSTVVVPRMDPRLARRLDQQLKMAGPGETQASVKHRDTEGLMDVDAEKPQLQPEPKPAIKRDPRQRGRGASKPKVSADGAGRKNRMDYASPLSTYESEEDRPSGYSSYQRRRQPRPPVLPVDVVPAPAMAPPPPPAPPTMHDLMPTMPPPGVISDDLLFEADQAMKSLKDVFKTKDPTASPFC